MITHLESGILECKVKWALGSITTNKDSGGDGIAVELFQILKDDAIKVLNPISQQIWKTQQWPQGLKNSVFIPVSKKGNAKECSKYCTIALISSVHGIFQEAGKVVWYSYLFKNFPHFVVIHTVTGFGIFNKAEVDVFLELSCFFYDPTDVGNLFSGSSAFSKSSLNI